MYNTIFKRFLDILIVVIGVVLLSPVLIFVMLTIKFTSKGEVFYVQKRLGKNAEPFSLYKFRSMYIDKERDIHKQVFKNNSTVTPIGKVIRRYKIDELAQLFNVLKGDMAIVGPRPCLPALKDDFDDNAWKRFEVKPGLTGLAQVNGNIYLNWNQRWLYDKNYVENLSFMLDVKIIIKTFLIVIFGEEHFKKEIKK